MAQAQTGSFRGSKKKIPAETQKRRPVYFAIIVVGLILAGIVQNVLAPARNKEQDEGHEMKALGGLNNEFLLLPLLGFRQAAAGLLWVRCDEFFDSGDYDAILPLVRVITYLDPHDTNVYITGAWHMSYNFTDSQERSDRRYIYPSQALLEEGIKNNEYTPDVKFEKGWECFDKIKNFPQAAEGFEEAIATKPLQGSEYYPYGAPLKTYHILAHTYEKEGRIPEAIAEWRQALAISSYFLKKNGGTEVKDFSDYTMQQAEKHNLGENIWRYQDRYLTKPHTPVNTSNYPGVLWPFGGAGKPAPWDVHLTAHIQVIRPKVLKFTGTFNSADGARVDVLVEDWDYKPHINKDSTTAFAVDPHQTILMDSISVRKDTFDREMDMSKDPKMYNFSHEYYRIVMSFDPRTTAPFVQDRFGWNGEGITDGQPGHVSIDPTEATFGTKFMNGFAGTGPVWDGKTAPWDQFGQPDHRVMLTFKVSLQQMLGEKPITDANIVPNKIMPLGPDMQR